MAKIGIPVVQIEIKTVGLTKALLKQMEPIEQFVCEYLPGGKEAQDEDYTILGWVHGSVLEAGETYWCWLVIMLRRGVYVRMRVSSDDLKRWKVGNLENRQWAKELQQIYL